MSDEYVKYQHIEKLGSNEVDGVMIGDVYIFPKIDGTNAQAWYDGEKMCYGSRNRELSLDNDNAGFMTAMVEDVGLTELCKAYEGHRVFGEWLVPHSLKTYRDDAWRKFYIFDIATIVAEKVAHLHYDIVQTLCEANELDYIPPIRIIRNPAFEDILKTLDQNDFLIRDGEGIGEGVVLKNYQFENKYGRQTWAKVITSEFKEKHNKTMGAPITKGTDMVEEHIVIEYVTTALIEKTIAKISLDNDGWNSKLIPQLIGRVYHDLVKEHSFDFCKKFKNPTVNFKILNKFYKLKKIL